MYEAADFIRSLKPKEKLTIQGKDGTTSNPKDCTGILTDHFHSVFYNKNCGPIPHVSTQKMKTPF